jgi:hypothetical protein
MESDYGRAAGRSQFVSEKSWPRVVLGNVAGPSSTPFAEEGSHERCFNGRQKGVDVRDLSKNVREQRQPMNRGQLANARNQVLELERFRKKPVSAGGETLFLHFARAVRTHDQDLRLPEVTLDVFQQFQANRRRMIIRGHLQIENRDIGLVKGRPSNRGLHVVGGHHVVLVAKTPIELLRNHRIIVNYQNPGLHRGSVPAFLLSGVEQSPYRRLIDLREREQSGFRHLQRSLRVDGGKQASTIVNSEYTKGTKMVK